MTQQNKPQRMERTENEEISAQEGLIGVLRKLSGRRREVEKVLPLDITFDNFYSSVNQALRNNPDLLDATPISIVNACVKAAYDGLRLDGREAALVTHKVKVCKSPERYEVHAQYFPMVFGLVQQILRGGEVVSITAEVVYEKDSWRIVRGTNSEVFHEPNMVDADPGPMLFAYTVATFKNGTKETAYLRRFEIEDVMKASKSGWHTRDEKPIGVWARWPRQMWLKTVLRFHRKTLPLGNRQIVDKEQEEMFPDMQPRAAALGHNQQTSMPARPTRDSAAQLEHDNSSAFADFGNRAIDGDPVEQERSQDRVQEQQQAKQQDPAKSDPAKSEPALPADDVEWGVWEVEMTANITKAQTVEELGELHGKNRDAMDAAPDRFMEAVQQAFTDRAADLAADDDDGAAADGANDDTAAGGN